MGSRPFQRGIDPRRNREGRPKGARRLAREVLGDDGEALVRYLAGVFNDASAPTSDRIMAAGSWRDWPRGSTARMLLDGQMGRVIQNRHTNEKPQRHGPPAVRRLLRRVVRLKPSSRVHLS